MFGAFRRPVGAAADVKELEYISALHQTSNVMNTDATVSAQDVLYYLRSRYGLDITSDDAIDIVRGLNGTSRLPLPQVEKTAWGLRKQKEATQENAPHHKTSARLRKRRCKCCNSAGDEDEEDELAALEAQLKSLKESKTDTRRGWEFPALQRQIHREVPKNVTTLVRYDLVQMISILLIPSLLRIERHRFKQELAAPPPRAPLFADCLNVYNLLWNSSKMAHKIIKAPATFVQKARHKRLARIKESLRPKPDTLILDVLRIMLGSLEERDSPFVQLSDFAATGGSTTTGTTTTGTGKGRHFPELRETVVTKELIQRILLNVQQDKAAQDDDLIEQMMDLVGGEGAILDERAFAHALTADVTRWPLECEDDVSTTFFDVYGFGNVECNKYAKEITPEDLLAAPSRDNVWSPLMAEKHDISEDGSLGDSSNASFHSAESELKDIEKAIKKDYNKIYESTMGSTKSGKSSDTGTTSARVDPKDSTTAFNSEQSVGSENATSEKQLRMGKIPKFKATAGYIDYACDSFSSMQLVVFLFGFFLVISGQLVALISFSGAGRVNCEESFGCQLVNTIVSWGVFALILSCAGLFVILPISLVNQCYLRSLPQTLFAFGLLICYLAFPLVERFLVEYVGIPVSQSYLTWRDEQPNRLLEILFYSLGGLTFLAVTHAIGAFLLPKKLVRRFAILRWMFVPNDIIRSSHTKRSGTYKLNGVIDRSYRLHYKAHKKTKSRNADHETMLSFLLYGEKDAKSGGLLWSWRNWNYLNKREGVWVHSRLALGQCGQIMILLLFILLWRHFTIEAADSSEAKRAEMEGTGGLGTEWALYFIPEAWMIYYSFIPGGIVCICVLVLLILITYPNTASLILKYRSGYLPTLHDPQFQKYRKGPAYMYYNTGNMIYAAIGAAGMFFVLVAGILFLCLWPPTAYFMSLVVAWGVGLSITVGAKMLLTMVAGTNYWKGFYRRRPAASNVSSLAYECWHLGLGGGVLVSRLCQFLLAAAFWIGRIDSQFLSYDVEAFGYHFDTVPQKYFTEILEHDAHRHPFIERLGAMYLMRLKHGEYFSTDAGAQWRVVFVLTLMPWLVKFSHAREQDVDDDSNESADDPDWQLGEDSNDFVAANGSESDMRVSGNVPWNPSPASDDDFSSVASADSTSIEAMDSKKRRMSLKRYESATSFKSINAGNGEDVGTSGRSSSLFASARGF